MENRLQAGLLMITLTYEYLQRKRLKSEDISHKRRTQGFWETRINFRKCRLGSTQGSLQRKHQAGDRPTLKPQVYPLLQATTHSGLVIPMLFRVPEVQRQLCQSVLAAGVLPSQRLALTGHAPVAPLPFMVGSIQPNPLKAAAGVLCPTAVRAPAPTNDQHTPF